MLLLTVEDPRFLISYGGALCCPFPLASGSLTPCAYLSGSIVHVMMAIPSAPVGGHADMIALESRGPRVEMTFGMGSAFPNHHGMHNALVSQAVFLGS